MLNILAMVTYILSSISRSKDNRAIKFGQLIEYEMKNIFLEESYRKCGGEASSRPFYKKSKLKISLNQQSEILHLLMKCSEMFSLCAQVEVYQNILKLRRWLVFTLYKALIWKTKRGLGLVFCFIFCMIFKEKCFSCYILLTDQISFPDYLYFLRYCAICVLQLFAVQSATSPILELTLIFLSSRFSA